VPKKKTKSKVRKFRTVADVLAHEFFGNYWMDADDFKEIDEMADRLYRSGKAEDAIKILNHVFKAGMGLANKDLIKTKEELIEHLEEYREAKAIMEKED